MAVLTKKKVPVVNKVTGNLNALVLGRGGKVGLKRKMNPTVVAPPPPTAANTIAPTLPVAPKTGTGNTAPTMALYRAQSLGTFKGGPTTGAAASGVKPILPVTPGSNPRFKSLKDTKLTGNANALTRGRGKKKGLTKRQQMIGDKARRAFGKRKSKPKT